MLAAILHGKAARVEVEGQSKSWRELFREREDLLTATFFGRIMYLSSELRNKVLSILIGENATFVGDISNIVFWPSFPTEMGYVEPDVVLECEHATIIIEVKKENAMQYGSQWLNQINAIKYCIENQIELPISSQNDIFHVALGGICQPDSKAIFDTYDASELFNVKGYQIKWQKLLEQLAKLDVPFNEEDQAVLNDWFEAFYLFGLHQPITLLDRYLSLPELSAAMVDLLKINNIKEPTLIPKVNLVEFLSKNKLEEEICNYLLKKQKN